MATAPLLPATSWEAVRRCFNRGADRLATTAVRLANAGKGPSLHFQGPGLTGSDFALCPCTAAVEQADLLEVCVASVARRRVGKRQPRATGHRAAL